MSWPAGEIRPDFFRRSTMRDEHDDDMDLEVDDGLAGETEHYALVTEDDEQRDADASEVERADESRDLARRAQEGDGDDS
jgi:hypothetical protein